MGGSRLSGAGGNWITARPVGVRGGVDHQFTGEVRRVDTETIAGVLAQDRIALLSPIGYSPTGETFNLRAEELATAETGGAPVGTQVINAQHLCGLWLEKKNNIVKA